LNFFLDAKARNAAELFERASRSIKHRRYGEAPSAAIESDPYLSKAHVRRASIRFIHFIFRFFLRIQLLYTWKRFGKHFDFCYSYINREASLF
jgi:hypothetical protein